jgi:hypothetical protein
VTTCFRKALAALTLDNQTLKEVFAVSERAVYRVLRQTLGAFLDKVGKRVGRRVAGKAMRKLFK